MSAPEPENLTLPGRTTPGKTARWSRLAGFLALRRNTSLLLATLLLAGMGEQFWLKFAPKYLETLGAGVFIIGLFDALQTFLGAVYAYPGSWVTDRWGQRRSFLFFAALSAMGYAVVLLWHHWMALLAGAFLFLAWSALSLPATFTVVATCLKKDRHTMGIGMQSAMRRVPMLLGPVIGGLLVTRCGWERGIHYALLGCIGLGAISALIISFLADPEELAGKAAPPAAGFAGVVKSFSPALRELLVSDILIRFCERIPYAFVILWAMDHGHVSAEKFGLLTAIEMATAMLCYIPVAHLADKYGRRPFVLITFGFFTLFPLSLLWAHSFRWLVLAFAVRGLKEFGEPARKALIIAEANPQMRSRAYGAYYLIRDCVVTSGSFLGAWLWSISPQANFAGAAICGALGTLWFWRFVFRSTRQPEPLP